MPHRRELSPLAWAMLDQLRKNGPTWDGDCVSKSGRDELIACEIAMRDERGVTRLIGLQCAACGGEMKATGNVVVPKPAAVGKTEADHGDPLHEHACGCGVTVEALERYPVIRHVIPSAEQQAQAEPAPAAAA